MMLTESDRDVLNAIALHRPCADTPTRDRLMAGGLLHHYGGEVYGLTDTGREHWGDALTLGKLPYSGAFRTSFGHALVVQFTREEWERMHEWYATHDCPAKSKWLEKNGNLDYFPGPFGGGFAYRCSPTTVTGPIVDVVCRCDGCSAVLEDVTGEVDRA